MARAGGTGDHRVGLSFPKTEALLGKSVSSIRTSTSSTPSSVGEFTVFAPTDDAFAKIDPATIETSKPDAAIVTNILTYHAFPGRVSPEQVARPADHLMVDDASVLCGGVQTANATAHLVDTVLMPPAAFNR